MPRSCYVWGMKTALIVWTLLSAPISLFALGWGLLLIYREAGMAFFLIASVAVFTSALGIASLLDKRQPLPSRKQDAR